MQRYTVKRIPNGDNRVGAPEFLYEILGPGAPEKPIAVEGIATMIRDALEDAAEALLGHPLIRVHVEGEPTDVLSERTFEGELKHQLTPHELAVGHFDLCDSLDELQGKHVRLTIAEVAS